MLTENARLDLICVFKFASLEKAKGYFLPEVSPELVRLLSPRAKICSYHLTVQIRSIIELLYLTTSKAVVGGPAGPAMAGPLFWPKMVSAGPQFSIIRPKPCLPFQLFFFFFLKCGGPIN